MEVNIPKDNSLRKTPFNRLVKVASPLAELIGETELPRTQVNKKVWEYIKMHHLQNPANRKEILFDATLAQIFFPQKSCNMFELTRLINHHLSKIEA